MVKLINSKCVSLLSRFTCCKMKVCFSVNKELLLPWWKSTYINNLIPGGWLIVWNWCHNGDSVLSSAAGRLGIQNGCCHIDLGKWESKLLSPCITSIPTAMFTLFTSIGNPHRERDDWHSQNRSFYPLSLLGEYACPWDTNIFIVHFHSHVFSSDIFVTTFPIMFLWSLWESLLLGKNDSNCPTWSSTSNGFSCTAILQDQE